MSMLDHVQRYVALKRHLGCKYRNNEYMLLSWARYAMDHGEAIIRAETVIRWASEALSSAHAGKKLGVARRFAKWLHAEDDRHEIPHRDALGRARYQRQPPCLLNDTEIRMLMEAALQLPPAGSITPHTLHCIIGLIAATGLRRAEVCGLRFGDITPDGLVIRETKFRKSRLIPLSESTSEALQHYLAIRTRLGGAGDRVFVLSRGQPIHPATLTGMFVRLTRATGLRGGYGAPGPRLHDLRHRFAVRSLEQAVATDRSSVNRHILALATYLGHTNVSSTYWYLEATPVLLRHIARDTEAVHTGSVAS